MMEIAKLIESEIGDFFAGFGHPGEPEAPEEMQSQLLARVMPLLASMEQEPALVVGDDGGDALAYRRLIQKFAPGTKLYAAPQLPQPAVVDADDNFYSWFGRFWLENYQQNNYTTSAKQMLGTMAEFAYRAGRESAALAGNSPVIPDGWVACSERMPEAGDDMIVFTDDIVMSGISYSKKKGFYIQALEYDDDEPVDNVTHWMPLPAEPRLA